MLSSVDTDAGLLILLGSIINDSLYNYYPVNWHTFTSNSFRPVIRLIQIAQHPVPLSFADIEIRTLSLENYGTIYVRGTQLKEVF